MERVNLEHPELLADVARQYKAAGADIVQTNTFGGSPLKLAQYDLDDRTEEISAAAVKAVREAAGDETIVSGSCGPSGRMLQPYGDTEPKRVEDAFRRQMIALAEAGVDVFCIETMMDLAEAQIAVRAAKAVAPSIPVMATMTFDPLPQGFFTVMGVGITQAADGLREAGADIIGSNCGNGIDNMVKIAAEFGKASDLPLIIQSNAGLPKIAGGDVVYPETPDFMAARIPSLVNAGVKIVGGCCGTAPDHIAAFRKAVDSLR
jgi:5-methyltetrahydrofolate--homocysteine methyltransferase